jgi:hypothetical protein
MPIRSRYRANGVSSELRGNVFAEHMSLYLLIGTHRLGVFAEHVRNRPATTNAIGGTFGGILGRPRYLKIHGIKYLQRYIDPLPPTIP